MYVYSKILHISYIIFKRKLHLSFCKIWTKYQKLTNNGYITLYLLQNVESGIWNGEKLPLTELLNRVLFRLLIRFLISYQKGLVIRCLTRILSGYLSRIISENMYVNPSRNLKGYILESIIVHSEK